MMKPIADLDDLLKRAVAKNIFGTKMRSFIKSADPAGIRRIAEQQFEYGNRIAAAGLVRLSSRRWISAAPKRLRLKSCLKKISCTSLTCCRRRRRYAQALHSHRRQLLCRPDRSSARNAVVALSGGYTRDEADELLAKNAGLIASFSRAFPKGYMPNSRRKNSTPFWKLPSKRSTKPPLPDQVPFLMHFTQQQDALRKTFLRIKLNKIFHHTKTQKSIDI
jgi:hypothetical protein